MSACDCQSILVTGGTGSFGRAFIKKALETDARRIIVLSRDELKQSQMMQEPIYQDPRMRFFIGDVRDKDRLYRAFDGVDIVIHAAALKQIDACSYNPAEAVKTNVLGAMNIIDAAIDCGVRKVMALSTDKACEPTTLYGKTKACLEGLVCAAGAYVGKPRTLFSCVRYGNVGGSRGSVIPFFKNLVANGRPLTVTSQSMTRFHMRLEQAVDFVMRGLCIMQGGEVFIPKLPSYRIMDLVKAFGTDDVQVTGIRKQEKLHEVMVGREESREVRDYGDYYCLNTNGFYLLPDGEPDPGGASLPEGFEYSSGTNPRFLSVDELKAEIQVA